MNCPRWLKDDAAEFWKRHAKPLEQAGVLTDRDVDGFALLCEVWRLLRNTDPLRDSKEAVRYIALVKQAQALMKQFGLMPRDRKRSKIESEKDELKEFAG